MTTDNPIIQVGQKWERKSYPTPTIVDVVAMTDDSVTIRHNRRRYVTTAHILHTLYTLKEERSDARKQ